MALWSIECHLLLTTPWSLDLRTKLILVGVEKRQVTRSLQGTRSIIQTFPEQDCLDSSGDIWISCSMTQKGVHLGDVCTFRKWVLIDPKADRVGKIGTLVTE